MSDSLYRLQKISSKISYKPGWKINIQDYASATSINGYDPYIYLILTMFQPNLDRPNEQIKLQFSKTIDPYSISRMTDEQIVEYIISGLVREAELHEMDEWLKYDGIHVKEPHPELKAKP